MSATEWKSGDVAFWKYGTDDQLVAIRVHGCRDAHRPGFDHWHLSNGGWTENDTYIRRLVVLDPESDEDVRRLLGAFYSRPGEDVYPRSVSAMRAALRELANPTPPKPDEPKGLGAVVEDTAGDHWIRHCLPTCEDGEACIPWRRVRDAETDCYDEIRAVRKLSEGVVPE